MNKHIELFKRINLIIIALVYFIKGDIIAMIILSMN